ncbi:ankyrin repeat domain-containing protein [Parendozoicomonas haliclonae]|uniref:Ankyrin repeats (3 copies) n=1 Tax=Parendozoicomonas haliclonae TaxID=1960125 RepID=A0A1X7AL61_9GAMM|nr:ankyrin repeat domain-containing protein [Parendozoicomonas haliclonae]SMA45391.1 Ankyrin repeats (3 copies) [Parendozoicomonas haliclonae]
MKNPLITALLSLSLPLIAGLSTADNAVDSQIIPEYELAETKTANDKVEEIVLRAYAQTFEQLKQSEGPDEAIALLNAPISGKTEKRGRHLLSFAAFSGFRMLAQWGLENGADINAGDKDNATMLRMSMANRLYYMVDFVLHHGGNPNLIAGDGQRNMIGDMMTFGWPLRGFELAWEYGARLENAAQKTRLIQYLSEKDMSREDNARRQAFLRRLDAPEAIYSGAWQQAAPARQVETEMIDVMDREIIAAIEGGELPPSFIAAFSCHGTPLPHYLSFNGMTKSLNMILEQGNGVELARLRDRTGNDLLTAAIKSLNVDAVRAVLNVYPQAVVQITPNLPNYYSAGDYPLHIAVKWMVSDEIFALLLKHGGSDSLNKRNKSGQTPLEMVESWYTYGYLEQDAYDRLNRALQQY